MSTPTMQQNRARLEAAERDLNDDSPKTSEAATRRDGARVLTRTEAVERIMALRKQRDDAPRRENTALRE